MNKILQLATQQAKILNLILILVCLLGFFYQVYLISSQYALGKTVVNIELKRLKSQPLPAITVCLWNHFISISKLSKLNKFNKKFYQDYINLFEEIMANDSLTNEVNHLLNIKTQFHLILKTVIKLKNLTITILQNCIEKLAHKKNN